MADVVQLQVKPIVKHMNLRTMKIEDVLQMILDTHLDDDDIKKLKDVINKSNNINEVFNIFTEIIKSKQEKR